MAAGYRELMRSRVFLGYALNTAFTTAVFFAFLAGAPYIMIEVLKRPASEYGMLFILVSAGYALGNFIAARLAVKVGARRLVLAGSLVNLTGVLVMGAVGLAGEFSALAIFLPMCIVAVGNGLGMPNGIAAAISVNPRLAGSASGLLGFLQMSVGAVSTVAVGFLKGDDQMAMVAVMMVTVLLSLLAYGLAVSVRVRADGTVPAPGTTD
jgi:DHA1 family bicyclomycin/chloramphenicol resistance-like MFS transporter